ncbi:hypothetical protein ACFVT2_18280 [Streptomyces sp. NPDC058000]|uniref:hypothetical protein n=1 Tax=Streptomyces sp. NPDC058000 TaxID=3346299 RepID=UPI0036F0FD19
MCTTASPSAISLLRARPAGFDLDALIADVFGLDNFDNAVAAFRAGIGRKIQLASPAPS